MTGYRWVSALRLVPLLAICLASGAAPGEDAESPRRQLWPEGKLAAITLGFDVDGETVWWDPPGSGSGPSDGVSQGRYGPREGVPKILELLARHELRATFFVPTWVAQAHPEMVRSIAAGGHEVGAHGVKHVSPSRLAPEQERRLLRESLSVLERIVGVRPVGYRAPSWSLSQATLRLVAGEGFLYSSNLMDSDLPYVHPEPAGLVELPVSWVLDDAAYFWFDGQGWEKPIASAGSVLEIWKEEFEAIHSERAYFNLTLHPQFIGRPARLRMLDRFLAWVKEFDGVWFATAGDVARRVARSSEPTPSR